MAEFEKCVKIIFQREGGFVNDAVDFGGATKYGITKRTLELFRKKPVSTEDVRQLTIEEAKRIYKQEYWDKMNLDQVAGFKKSMLIFDLGVNSGIGTSALRTQSILNMMDDAFKLKQDASIGPLTIKALNQVDDLEFCLEFVCRGIDFYVDICQSKPSQLKFLGGWMNRAQENLKLVVLS